MIDRRMSTALCYSNAFWPQADRRVTRQPTTITANSWSKLVGRRAHERCLVHADEQNSERAFSPPSCRLRDRCATARPINPHPHLSCALSSGTSFPQPESRIADRLETLRIARVLSAAPSPGPGSRNPLTSHRITTDHALTKMSATALQRPARGVRALTRHLGARRGSGGVWPWPIFGCSVRLCTSPRRTCDLRPNCPPGCSVVWRQLWRHRILGSPGVVAIISSQGLRSCR